MRKINYEHRQPLFKTWFRPESGFAAHNVDKANSERFATCLRQTCGAWLAHAFKYIEAYHADIFIDYETIQRELTYTTFCNAIEGTNPNFYTFTWASHSCGADSSFSSMFNYRLDEKKNRKIPDWFPFEIQVSSDTSQYGIERITFKLVQCFETWDDEYIVNHDLTISG